MLLALRQRVSLLMARLGRDGETDGSTWVIDARKMGFRDRLAEFWRFRRTLWFFATRMVMKRYQGTALGRFWLFARPLAPILINTFIFGGLLGLGADGVPYFLFFLTGMTIWMLFDRSLLWVTRSLDMNKNLVKKIYFPRLIIPIASVASSVTEVGIYSALIACGALFYLVKDGHMY